MNWFLDQWTHTIYPGTLELHQKSLKSFYQPMKEGSSFYKQKNNHHFDQKDLENCFLRFVTMLESQLISKEYSWVRVTLQTSLIQIKTDKIWKFTMKRLNQN